MPQIITRNWRVKRSADGLNYSAWPTGDHPSFSAYTTTFPTVETPLSEGGVWVSQDPNSTRPKVVSSGKCVSQQTGTPPPYNDAQAGLDYRFWTPTQYWVEITVAKDPGLDATNREVEVLIDYRDDYPQFTADFGLTTTKCIEINWHHTGSYMICGRYKVSPEIGRINAPPSPSNGDRLRVQKTLNGANQPEFQVWVNDVQLQWLSGAGYGSVSADNLTLTDTLANPFVGAPGIGFYRDTGNAEQFWITKFQAQGL